jgi:hypothetical protein
MRSSHRGPSGIGRLPTTPDDGDRRVGFLPFIGPSRPGSFESADDNVPVPDDAGSHKQAGGAEADTSGIADG